MYEIPNEFSNEHTANCFSTCSPTSSTPPPPLPIQPISVGHWRWMVTHAVIAIHKSQFQPLSLRLLDFPLPAFVWVKWMEVLLASESTSLGSVARAQLLGWSWAKQKHRIWAEFSLFFFPSVGGLGVVCSGGLALAFCGEKRVRGE